MPTVSRQLIRRLNRPGPRYTSYPTVPEWGAMNGPQAAAALREFGASGKSCAAYVHIPFCESMCSFCGCTTNIRRPQERYADDYLDLLETEASLIKKHLGSSQPVHQLHWGGGSPSFLNTRQTERLMAVLKETFAFQPDMEQAIELDPRRVDAAKLADLRARGFNRISFGLQDLDENVLTAVNRRMPSRRIRDLTRAGRELGFHSLNYDLIYGLPHQTEQTFSQTVRTAASLRPNRLAVYSFAYVPWLKPHQNKMAPDALPGPEEKIDIFLAARKILLQSGYRAIGMDHFALEDDELVRALDNHQLNRNFMGYTVTPGRAFIGLGASAISFLESVYFQNAKGLPEYAKSLREGDLPVRIGKTLDSDDLIRDWVIHALMCRFRIDFSEFAARFRIPFETAFPDLADSLKPSMDDGLLTRNQRELRATDLGRLFIRNICMHFDRYLQQKGMPRQFSQTV